MLAKLGWLLVALVGAAGLGRARPAPRRDDQRRLAGARRRRHLPRRLPLLLPLPRRPGLRSRRPPRHARRAARQRARLRAHLPLGAVRPPLRRDRRRRARWSGRCSPPSSATCPGTIWIVFGVVLGGAVQDFIILFGSMRRDGKSLGQMAKEEIGPLTGAARHGRDPRDHDHPARGARAGGRERAQGQPVGRLHHRSAPSPSRS